MHKALQGSAIVIGLLAALFSLLAGLLLALMAVFGRNGTSLTAAASVALAVVALGCGLGVALAWAGWGSLQGWPRRPLVLPSPWLLALLFLLALAAGELVRSTALAPVILPPLHVLASVLPPLALVAAVAGPLQRAGAGLSTRDLAWQVGYGALIATFIAITLEVAAGFGTMATAGLLVAVLPGGQATLDSLNQALQSPALAMDPERVLDTLLTPLTILAAALFLAVLTPLIEETCKSLGVWLAGTARSLGRARAFALGVMAGAGFSLTEALFNGAAQLPAAWAGPVVLRAGTVLIHGLATGLLALGWYEVLARRPWRFAAYAVAGIGLHGFWNGLGGLSGLAGLGLVTEGAPGLHVGIALLSGIMLVGTLVVSALVLAWLTTTLVSETRRQATPGDDALLLEAG